MAKNELLAPNDVLEKVIIGGDLARLSSEERLQYYWRLCESLGLNPLTRPFDYILLQGKLTLYARRDCTDQLRRLHRVSVKIVARERLDDVYVVTARAMMPDGRRDEAIGAVPIQGLKGEALANALMKAETKAKRRVTLSIVGLGWLDETEIETIPDAAMPTQPTETSEHTEPSQNGARRQRLLARWQELWAEADAAGVPEELRPRIADDATDGQISAAGKRLKSLIQEATAASLP